MRAKVFTQNLNLEDCIKTIKIKLAAISDLNDIRFNTEESSISFDYQTEDAAFLVLEKLNIPCYKDLKTN